MVDPERGALRLLLLGPLDAAVLRRDLEGQAAAQRLSALRRRISRVCQRTLRRQAQEFLERPFVKRRLK